MDKMETYLRKLVENSEYRAYNMSVLEYASSQKVTVVPDCFALMFTNTGDTIASVNGMVIFPSSTPATSLGDSRSISGHKMDLFKGDLVLSFANPAGVAPRVEIVQLFYVDPYKRL